MTDYQHKAVTQLAELYDKHKDELGKGIGMMALLWKAVSPQIPEILQGLDENPERLMQIKGFLEEIVEALREDVKEGEGEDKIEEDTKSD